ncbi:MAG TPA: MFS transporter [Stellaceae bacterium]|jgi:MFS family permease
MSLRCEETIATVAAKPEPAASGHLGGLLVETTAVQALSTMAVLTIPAIAPKVAEAIGMPASSVGYQISVLYLAAMASSLVAGTVVGRLGPCRTSQFAMLLVALGCMIASIPYSASVAFGSFVIGVAYGFPNPAASELLSRHVPPGRRNLVFSIKQTGVPLGGMAAGLIGPSVAIAFGWQAALWLVALASVLVAAASQPMRAALDAHRDRSARSRLSFDALRTVRRDPALLRLALSSFFFSAIQLCVIAFLVVLLVQEVGLDLVAAGMILAAVQIAGAVGRLLWGWIADRIGDGLAVLLGLAVVMAGGSAAVIAFSPSWPLPAIGLVFVVLGLSAVGWNGVYLSEIARLSPARAVSSLTGAAMFITFSGVVISPVLFSALHAVLGSYTRSYGLLVLFGLVGAALVAGVRGKKRAGGPEPAH